MSVPSRCQPWRPAAPHLSDSAGCPTENAICLRAGTRSGFVGDRGVQITFSVILWGSKVKVNSQHSTNLLGRSGFAAGERGAVWAGCAG